MPLSSVEISLDAEPVTAPVAVITPLPAVGASGVPTYRLTAPQTHDRTKVSRQANVIEYNDWRYYLVPDDFTWYAQPAKKSVLRDLSVMNAPPRAADYDFARNPYDFLLLTITNRCNIVCDYCFRGFNMKKTRELTLEEFQRIADHFLARAEHKPTFQFTGGEVFVKEDIEHMFDYIHERDFRIWMTTNGVSSKIRNSPVIRRIFENNPKVHVRVSCDGHRADLYERHRGKPGTFARVEKNLKYLVSIGVPVSIKSVVTSENFPYIEEILEWAYDLGLSGWNYNVIRYTGALSETPPPDATAVSRGHVPYLGYFELGRKLTDIIRRKPHLAYLLAISRYGKILDTLYGERPHGVRMMYYTLNYDGEVYTNDNLYRPEFSCGNIRMQGMDAFRHLPDRYDALDRDLACCQRCPIHRFCFQKGDYGELFDRDPTLQAEFPNCPDIRQHFYDMLALRQEGFELTRRVNSFPPGIKLPV